MSSKWRNPLPLRLVPVSESESFHFPEGITGVPRSPHPGGFAVPRRYHVHEGVDLYCPVGTRVTAVEDGTVVAILDFTGSKAIPPSPWWHDTQAVMVEGQSGVILYGEILTDLRIGNPIQAGDEIGRVIPVLKTDKGRPMSMLHLELHLPGTRDAVEWVSGGPRPPSLLDPTELLDSSL